MFYFLKSFLEKLPLGRKRVKLQLISLCLPCYEPVGFRGQKCLLNRAKFTLMQRESVAEFEKLILMLMILFQEHCSTHKC